MINKLVFRFFILFTFLLAAQNAVYAFSLGQIELQSNLGEPLKALLPVTVRNGEDIHHLKAGLADKATWQAMSIEYGFIHTNIDVEFVAEDEPYILLSTQTPFNEPYLQLVLAVSTPKQQFNRSLTLLFDAPDNTGTISVFN